MSKKPVALAVSMLPFLTTVANADSSEIKQYGEVNSTALHVRTDATASSEIIGYLKKGDKVTILDKQNNWYKIKFKEEDGWVYSQYITLLDMNTENKETRYTTDSVNFRTGPGTLYKVQSILDKDTEVNFLTEKGSWSKVEYESSIGYIYNKYLTKEKPNVIIPPEIETPTDKEQTSEETPTDKEQTSEGATIDKEQTSEEATTEKEQTNIETTTDKEQTQVETTTEKEQTQVDNNEVTSSPNASDLTPPQPLAPNASSNVSEGNKTAKMYVTVDKLNVRKEPKSTSDLLGRLALNDVVKVISADKEWFKIEYNNDIGYVHNNYLSYNKVEEVSNNGIEKEQLHYTLDNHLAIQFSKASSGGNTMPVNGNFVPASKPMIKQALNVDEIKKTPQGMLQFLTLDQYREGVTAEELNSYFSTFKQPNVFVNQGETFIKAAKENNIDVLYLVAHAVWETGYGQSTLAKGQTISSYKGQAIPPTKVYNFFGIGAFDRSANLSGAQAAYSNGWTSIEATIEGSAKWLAENYIHSEKFNQNTLFTMKFNHDIPWHQYATDIKWPSGIASKMYDMIHLYDDTSTLKYRVPEYKKN